jgi:ribosomal protein S18 acetylase RimI-like enzyme
MTVRVGSARDVDAALAVWRACERERSQPPGQGRTTRARDALRAPTSLLLVAGEPVVGMLLVELVARRLELTMLFVEPDSQRAGVARSLVDALLARYPVVHAWSTTPDACVALGFTPTGVTRDGAVEVSSG